MGYPPSPGFIQQARPLGGLTALSTQLADAAPTPTRETCFVASRVHVELRVSRSRAKTMIHEK
ncbi:BQ5605_C016g08116 [Microbotryum silenes-dioicae]|uniref:BQ5605_C016g08116 protein n=1 Tax=Microbotryum silenes-dioicae TaxID=796604 RepID=A0A2X0NSZ5_9BASI|nr:BQ5605_C016g08116 [Microbotryum silenes-dioicae]